MALKIGEPTKEKESKKRDETVIKRTSGKASKFGPFFDDKKREIEPPEVPEWRVYKSGQGPKQNKRQANFVPTGIKELDRVLGGGLPNGLTIFVGEAGSGKSTMARLIASTMKNALYVCAEKQSDDPESEDVMVMDYRSYLPKWYKALAEILVTAEKLNSSVIILDSSTRLFSGTNKAVEEADLRPALFELARKTEGKIPVIAISEVRGSGWNLYPAGGQAVSHAGIVLVWFNKFVIRGDQTADRFDKNVGDKVWTLEISKDSRNLALATSEFEVIYDKNGNLKSLKEPTDTIRTIVNGK